MTTTDVISPDLASTLRRLKLSPISATLPERLSLARQQKMPHQDFLLLILQDEATRREGMAASRRAQRANLDPAMIFEAWDETAKVTYDKQVLNELVSLRFVDAHNHAAIYGSSGVGKTFMACALGNAACRRGYSVLLMRHDKLLKVLKHARLDNTHDAELCKLLAVDLLVVDDFCLDTMDAVESRDTYEILVERHRAGSMIVTSNRDPEEWHSVFADPARAQAAVDRFTNNAYDLVMSGESYRQRQKPRVSGKETTAEVPPVAPGPRGSSRPRQKRGRR
jgi:DNA replication protein DnaC